MRRELRVVLGQPLVLDDHDSLRPVPRGLERGGREVHSEHERHVLATELSRELSSLSEQLEGSADRAAVHMLDERPAVVVLARTLAEALRLVPRPRLDATFCQA